MEDNTAVLDYFKGLRVTDVCDGMDTLGIRDIGLMSNEIRPLWRDIENFSHRFVGRAHTIRFVPTQPYCVITHEDLAASGQVISQYHNGEMVTIQQIYDEFGWGVPDVTAIRDFLRWRYERGGLELVLLLGDATWDYKGYLTGETFTNYVPSYERRYRVAANNPYNTLRRFRLPKNSKFGRSRLISIIQKNIERPINGKVGEPEKPGDDIPRAWKNK